MVNGHGTWEVLAISNVCFLLEAVLFKFECWIQVVNGYGTWEVLAIFCALVLLATTFISHTVGAMIILPIVQAVGAQMEVIMQLPLEAPFVLWCVICVTTCPSSP